MTKSKNSSAKGASRKPPRHPAPPSRPARYSAPAASTRVMHTARPSVSGSPYSGDGVVRVKHREYIGEISGSVGFAATQYPINPGLASSFPWLSSIAANYESYRFKNLSFEFETEKSSNTAGSVMLAVDFDAADAAPATKVALMSYQNAVRSAPWCPCAYRASGPDLNKFGVQRYNRSAALAANLDIKTYDVGDLVVATSGCADTSIVGELYVTYEVELHTPQLGASASGSGGELIIGVSGTTGTSWFGTTPTVTGTSFFTASGSTLTCAIAGTYLVSTILSGASAAAAVAPTGTSTITFPLVSAFTTSSAAIARTMKVVATVGQTVILNDTATTWSLGNVAIGSFF